MSTLIHGEARGAAPRRDAVSGGLLVAAAAALVLLSAVGVSAQQQTGRAVALSSDTLSLNNRTYQLFGIDGMDFNQQCFVDGQAQACGVSATRALQVLLDPAPVTCTPAGDAGAGVTFAKCTGAEGDIAGKLVEQGWALAAPGQADYVAAQDAARAASAGIWRGTFVMPWDYREGIGAIEAAYARRAAELTRTETEAAITAGEIGLGGLKGAKFSTSANAGGSEAVERAVQFAGFGPGFITAANPPPGVFSWPAVAGVLETTRQKGAAAIRDDVLEAIWTDLAGRPSRNLASRDSQSFYAALREAAEQWLAERRQPVLFVAAQDNPGWIRDWFGGNPPEGAEISRREDIADRRYIGTIDGIDVYVGPGRERASLVVPSDLLTGVVFRAGEEGGVLALDADAAAGNTWTARYALALSWRDDEVVWIGYPPQSAATPDA